MRGMKFKTPKPVLIRWHFFSKEKDKHVTEWIPGKMFAKHCDGRVHVVADNGWVALDAHPKNVKAKGQEKGV